MWFYGVLFVFLNQVFVRQRFYCKFHILLDILDVADFRSGIGGLLCIYLAVPQEVNLLSAICEVLEIAFQDLQFILIGYLYLSVLYNSSFEMRMINGVRGRIHS